MPGITPEVTIGPIPENQLALDPTKLFIAHMQWIDKTFVAIKQYFWKVMLIIIKNIKIGNRIIKIIINSNHHLEPLSV